MRSSGLVQCAGVLTAFNVSDYEEFLSATDLRHVMANTGGRLTEDEVDDVHLLTTGFE